MIDVFPFAGYPVAFYGLDEAGLFTARALLAGEAELSAWDNDPDHRAQAEKAGISPIDFTADDLREFTTLVVSAKAWAHGEVAQNLARRALEQNLEVICDVELLARTQREAAYVGISGDRGKSLTAALVTYLMQVTGKEAEMAGLSGSSALNTDPMGVEGAYVVEMTSFRVDHTVSITFDVAVLLNLDDKKSSTRAKKIFHRQTEPRAAVISIDDKPSQAIFKKLVKAAEQRVYAFSIKQPVEGGVFVSHGTLYDSFDGGVPVLVMELSSIPYFAGPHAQANVAAAFACVRAIGVEPHAAMAAIMSFPGLVDHCEEIETIDAITYINDAASTSLECVASSFQGYDNIYWISGASADGKLPDSVSKKLKGTYMGGETGLKEAVNSARKDALEGGQTAVIIYAPGCACEDGWEGDAFRAIVEALPGKREDGD